MPDGFFLITAGLLLIILGIFLVVADMMRSIIESDRLAGHAGDQENTGKRVKGGGIILIGPVPVIFGSDKRSVLIAVILAIVVMLLAVFFIRSTI